MFMIYIITIICVFLEDANTVLLCVIVMILTTFCSQTFDGQVADQASYINKEHLVLLYVFVSVLISLTSAAHQA